MPSSPLSSAIAPDPSSPSPYQSFSGNLVRGAQVEGISMGISFSAPIRANCTAPEGYCKTKAATEVGQRQRFRAVPPQIIEILPKYHHLAPVDAQNRSRLASQPASPKRTGSDSGVGFFVDRVSLRQAVRATPPFSSGKVLRGKFAHFPRLSASRPGCKLDALRRQE
jgi:hypothetical protein